MVITFVLTVFAWIFFRAQSISQALHYIQHIFKNTESFLNLNNYVNYNLILTLIFVFVLVEWIGREGKYAIEKMVLKWSRPLRWVFYISLMVTIFYTGDFDENVFIYFQF